MNRYGLRERLGRLRPPQIALIAAVVVALSATVVAQPWTTSPRGASPAPSAPAGSPSTSPGPEGDWEAVIVEDIPAVAVLAASRQDDAGIAPDASFDLTSLTDEPATELAERLEISPPTDFRVASSGASDGATISPVSALRPGALYRLSLRSADGALAGSWAFRVRSPVHVLSTIPGDATTAVPIDTGIEVTFDQEGVADMADNFSIEPTVEGRFERHGRTQVFVPTALVPRTLYTVTVRAGLPRADTDLTLESDVSFSFETEGEARSEAWLRFGRDVVEASPSEAPVVAFEVVDPNFDEETPPAITSADIVVYRLPSLAAAGDALSDFLAAPRWAEHSDPLMPTDGLPAAARFSAPLESLPDSSYSAVRFPAPLPEGWYVVEVTGARPSQAFLQVTPVSAWVSVLVDRTVAWVNDVTTGAPVRGASVSIVGGPTIGESAANGLMTGPTPDALLPAAEAGDRAVAAAPPILAVRAPDGDTVLVPFEVGWDGEAYRGEWWEKSTPADASYWSLLLTERTLYRTTDRVETWGYLRARADDSIPRSVELRLIADAYEHLLDRPPVARVTATPDARGAFAAGISYRQLPLGSYRLLAVADGRVVANRWLEIGSIRKPAYQLSLVPDHLAVVDGATVTWTASASFFDGAPVPSVNLLFNSRDEELAIGPTEATGRATIALTAGLDDDAAEGAQDRYASVQPAGPEEGEIYASSNVLVFPSLHHLDADGVVTDGRLRVTGTIASVDLDAVEAALATGDWDGDPMGDPVGGASIQASVTELIPVSRLVGTDYDFVDKVVRPRYEWTIERKAVRTVTVTSGADGRIALDLAVPDPDHEYEVVLTTADAAGRTERRTLTAGAPLDLWRFDAGVAFETLAGTDVGSQAYGVGEQVVWRMTDNGAPLPSDGANRYLYIVAQRGLRAADVTTSSTFQRAFEAGDAPGIFVMGVRFTGITYAAKAAAWADYDEAERAISVTLSADRERYRPGEDATLTVRAADAAGRPVAASVVLQAVDEKLYAIGGAEVAQPLQELYTRVDSGIVRLTSTHQVPSTAGPEGEGGDTTGGGPRADFRDTLAFRALETSADGTVSTTIRLSDDLTSWHVTAIAVTGELAAGAGELMVPVSLPLFADATIADEYLVTDRPTIRLRAFGEALEAGDAVEFTISSASLGMAATTVTGTALTDVPVDLPALAAGSHSIDIAVTAPTRLDGATGKPLSDRLIRTVSVVSSRLTAARSYYGLAGDTLPSVMTSEAATYTFTDAGRGRYLPLLLALAEPAGARLDRGLAQQVAHDLLVEVFGRDSADLPTVTFDPTRYPIGEWDDDGTITSVGLALLPYGGVDPWLATVVALAAPNGVGADSLRAVLEQLEDDEGLPRELRVAALAGLAGLGEPVLADIRDALEQTDLTTFERIHLALGLRSLGDDAGARAIERAVLRDHGQRLGPWVRVADGDREATLAATSLMALLAAGLGDPLAPDMIEFVSANPTRESTHALELAGAVRLALERTPAAAASFAWTVDGRRTVVRLDPGESSTLSLTAAQRASLRVDRLSGEVGIAVAWRDLTDADALSTDPALRLTRTVPTSPIPSDRLLTVELTAVFGSGALASDCYEVVEQVPSGLAPVWTSPPARGYVVIAPSEIAGQRVTFCVPTDASARGEPTAHLAYVARVVNEGAFAWEPAVMQLPGVPEAVAVTGGTTTRIGG